MPLYAVQNTEYAYYKEIYTAQEYAIVEITKEEYDNRYIYYRYTNWEQPILTSNGTLDGDSFAVGSNVVQYPDQYEYLLFSNDNSNRCFHSTQYVTTGEIYLYNPNPLNITNILVTNQNASGSQNRASSKGGIYGFGKYGWELITEYTNNVQEINGQWNIDLSSNTKAYKKYMIKSTANGGADYWTMGKLTLTAKEAIPTEDKTDYDYKDMSALYFKVQKTKNYTVQNVIYEPITTTDKLIPNMTSVTAPEGTVTSTGSWKEAAYRAFGSYDNTATNARVNATSNTLTYTFAKPILYQEGVEYVLDFFLACVDGGTKYFTKVTFYGIDNNSEKHLLYDSIDIPQSTTQRIEKFYSEPVIIDFDLVALYVELEGKKNDLGGGVIGCIQLTQQRKGKVQKIKNYSVQNTMYEYYKYGTEPNTIVVGSPTNENGVISGFTTANYLKFPQEFKPESKTWEMLWKVTTGSSFTTSNWAAGIFGEPTNNKYGVWLDIDTSGHLRLFVGTGNGRQTVTSTTTLAKATTYYIKAYYTGTQYLVDYSTDNVTFENIIIIDYAIPMAFISGNVQMIGQSHYDGVIGGSGYSGAWVGSIDLNECHIKIDDKMWWNGTKGVLSTKDDYNYKVPIRQNNLMKG